MMDPLPGFRTVFSLEDFMKRRTFLALGAGAAGSAALPGLPFALARAVRRESPFRISLAEWSLNKTIRAGKMTNLDFPRVAKRQFGIDTIEFVDQFFRDKARDKAYLEDLRKRASDEGVKMGLIMIDTTGNLGDPDAAKRKANTEKTKAWIDCAKDLGCHTVRINARGPQKADDLRGWVSESGAALADHAAPMGINIVIENHGGLSSDPDWLVSVMKAVGKPNFGALPDFGNFGAGTDRYDAVEKLMPWAKAVSAKASRFTEDGLCQETDYFRMLRIVLDGGYAGHIGVESGARNQEGEAKSVEMTRDLLKRIFSEQERRKPLFNGKDLTGWVAVNGGEWAVRDGVLTGRNGRDWSTNPETSGSWLRTEKEYGDFRLELQYQINERGNSGVFFRSAAEKNPAFTGYEMQIVGRPDAKPSKGGPGSIYDVVAPSENRVRVDGRWNTVTLVAKGPRITVELNGKKIIDTEQDRSLKGYVGLQAHDARSEVRFRNVRLESLE